MIKKFNNFIREDKNHLNEMILDMEYILISFSDLGYNPSLVLEKDHLYVRLVIYTDKPLVWDNNLEEDINKLNSFARKNGFEECNVLFVLDDSLPIVSDRFEMDYESFLRHINISNKPITNLLLKFKKI